MTGGNARIQFDLECLNSHRWHRDHAHDFVGADGLPQAINHDCSLAVLEFRRLISGLAMRRLKVLD